MQQEIMNKLNLGNIFSQLPVDCNAEVFETIASSKNVRIERIVSCGQATPEGEWYDQKQDEWVLLLSGRSNHAGRWTGAAAAGRGRLSPDTGALQAPRSLDRSAAKNNLAGSAFRRGAD
jgi:hypothetical protein